MYDLFMVLITCAAIFFTGQPQSLEGRSNLLPTMHRSRRHAKGGGRSLRYYQPMDSKYPFIGLIRSNKIQLCGGSLISPSVVLTAAHCLQGETTDNLDVVLGAGIITSKTIEALKILKMVPHEGYNPKTYENDIAIVQLEKPVKISRRLESICLYAQGTTDEEATVAGWGQTESEGRASAMLMEAEIPVLRLEKCRTATKYQASEITDSVFCAGTEGRDACLGDGGGPLFVPLSNEDEDEFGQIGIVSWGRGCGEEGYPGVYTNVSIFSQWIKDHAPEAKFCKQKS